MTMGIKNDSASVQAKGNANWFGVAEMLQTGLYNEAARFLLQELEMSEKNGNDTLTGILATMHEICLDCSQLQDEMAWRQRAQQGAQERIAELNNQIHELFGRIRGVGEESPPQTSQANPNDKPREMMEFGATLPPENDLGFWQRFQNLLIEWRGASHSGSQNNSQPLPDHLETKPGTVADQAKNIPEHSFTINCLGFFRVYRNECVITNWHSLKGQSILKYLVAHHKTPVCKDVLMETFWPNADPESARRNLHQAIYSLRQTFKRVGPGFQPIQFEKECYLLNPEIPLSLDFQEFELSAEIGRQLEASGRRDKAAAAYQRAEAFYLGDFLQEDPYEDWIIPMRDQFHRTYLDLTERLSGYHWQQADYEAVIELCQKILAKDNCNEKAHRRLMQCYQNQGQCGLAIRQYRRCSEILKNELDVSPSVETRSLFDKITRACA